MIFFALIKIHFSLKSRKIRISQLLLSVHDSLVIVIIDLVMSLLVIKSIKIQSHSYIVKMMQCRFYKHILCKLMVLTHKLYFKMYRNAKDSKVKENLFIHLIDLFCKGNVKPEM